MAKLLFAIGIVISVQLAENQYEVIAESQPISVQKRSVPSLGPIGGMAVDHPLQATVYAYRRGRMKLLVPFELMIVPMGGGGSYLEPEHAPTIGYPISGQIKSQQNIDRAIYNRNPPYRQYPASQFGPSYYPSYTYQPAYAPYNGNNGFYNYNQQQSPYRNPYYPPRRIDISHTKPWPQYHGPSSQQGNTNPVNATNAASQQNATQNWSGNNTAINISSLVNNVTHSNESAPTTSTTTAAPEETTSSSTTIASPALPQQNHETAENVPPTEVLKNDVKIPKDMDAEASYAQPILVPPPTNFMQNGFLLPSGIPYNGEYNDQINDN